MKKIIFTLLLSLIPLYGFTQDMSIFTPYDFNGFKEEDANKLKTDISTLLNEKILSKLSKETDESKYKDVEIKIKEIESQLDVVDTLRNMFEYNNTTKSVDNGIAYIGNLVKSKGIEVGSIKNSVRKMFNDFEDKYRIFIYDHLSIGNNSQEGNTKFENMFAPSSSISFMYTFEANQIRERLNLFKSIGKGFWATFGGILNFTSQSTYSLDSINALAKILNYGPDMSITVNARVGTTPHRYLKFFIGSGFVLSYINSKSVDNKIVDGVPMVSFNFFGGMWAINDILFTGVKWERRFTDQEGWLYDKVSGANTWNLYASINFKENLSLLVSYLFKTNIEEINTQKSKNRLQVTFGTAFDLRGLKLP